MSKKKIVTLIFTLVGILLIILGVCNACRSVPFGTTYTTVFNETLLHGNKREYTRQFTFNLNGTYTLREIEKYDGNVAVDVKWKGTYFIVNNEVSCLNVSLESSNYAKFDMTFQIIDGNLKNGKDIYYGNNSWITIALCVVGSILIVIDGLLILLKKQKR